MNTAKITLLIFTCAGKEHLLPTCYSSFKEHCAFQFSKVVLAADGQIEPSVITQTGSDIIVQNNHRKGYIFNILNALALVDTEYFFWLEDDFIFEQDVPIERMLSTLNGQPNWAGIFLSRTAPLTDEEKQVHHFDEFYLPHYGYSVSPTLCRTSHIKAAFAAMLLHPKNNDSKLYGFETFMKDYFEKNDLSYALMDPGNIPHVNHFGKLESTAREYHMVNSLDSKISDIEKEYISGFGHDREIPIKSKILMLPKIMLSTLALGAAIFKSREAYDYALRIYVAYKKKFKN